MNPEENNNQGTAPGLDATPSAGIQPEAPNLSTTAPVNNVPEAESLNQAISPEPVAAPEVAPDPTSSTGAAPSLDQVAADLTSAAATNSLDQETAPVASATPVAPETPAAPTIPETPTMPEAPATPESPAAPATPEIPPAPEPAPAMDSAPVTSFTDPVQPMPSIDTAPAAPEAPASPIDSMNQTDPMAPASPAAPQAQAEGEEEPPLVPADPVPGSIGSAISYTDTTQPAMPVKEKKSFGSSLKLSKDNMRLVLIIGLGIVLVAVVVIVIISLVTSSSSKSSSSNNSSNNTPATPTTPTVSSLTCTKEGGRDVFSAYGEVVDGKEDIVAMYSDGYLSSFGTNLTLNYENEEAARYGEGVAREEYNRMLSSSSLTSDPFDSAYNVVDNKLTVTHQADGDVIEASNARALGLYVVKGEVVDDPDTLIDNYETDGYTCEEK